jgi:hypothetical protein
MNCTKACIIGQPALMLASSQTLSAV